jgi:hypothetical protein
MNRVVIASLCVVVLNGCGNATKQIAESAGEIPPLTTKIKDDARSIDTIVADVSTAHPDAAEPLAPIYGHTDRISTNADRIGRHAKTITTNVANVENKENPLHRTIRLVAFAVVVVAAVWLLFQTGVGRLLRSALGLIPAPTKARARLDFESYHTSGPRDPALEASIAVARSNDPAYNRAWEQAKRESQEKEAERRVVTATTTEPATTEPA